jgi:hypothetical protein
VSAVGAGSELGVNVHAGGTAARHAAPARGRRGGVCVGV